MIIAVILRRANIVMGRNKKTSGIGPGGLFYLNIQPL
jgi:hypothetical protein